MRIKNHPILGPETCKEKVTIYYDGQSIDAFSGEPIAAALIAIGVKKFRITQKNRENRGLFCAIGRCTDCVMIVDGIPNTRTCITPVRDGMTVETQEGTGTWSN